MPLVPNVNCLPGGKTLDEFFNVLPVLRKLDADNRLIWYWLEHSLTKKLKPRVKTPSIRPKNFSVEAVINILGELGVKAVRSYGIDGGASYRPNSVILRKGLCSKMVGRPSILFDEIASITKRFSMDYQPCSEPNEDLHWHRRFADRRG